MGGDDVICRFCLSVMGSAVMMNAAVLSLVYQRQAAGDGRSVAEILPDVLADLDAVAAALVPAPAADAVVGGGRIIKGGKPYRVTVRADGQREEVAE